VRYGDYRRIMATVGSALEREDVDGILAGLFDLNTTLVRVERHLAVIRTLLGEELDEEQEDE
jgi:hypothetical protein